MHIYITEYNYLSISKEYLDNTSDINIRVGVYLFNIDKLRNNITYRDNMEFYRWKFSSYNRCKCMN